MMVRRGIPLLIFIAMTAGCSQDSLPVVPPDSDAGWQLIWSDEFDSTSLDLSRWNIETGGGGWGDNEKEFYREENLSVSGGNLIIEARKENFGGNQYTSGRITTLGLESWTYGKIKARMKLPYGKGIWPVFRLVGENGDWPASGDIVVAEMAGGPGASPRGPGSDSRVYGAMHWQTTLGYSVETLGSYEFFKTKKFSDDFHDFIIVWDSTQVQWFVDGANYKHYPINTSGLEAFHKPFYIVLNLAVGGNFPGEPDTTTVFPQRLTVDYVHIYKPLGNK